MSKLPEYSQLKTSEKFRARLLQIMDDSERNTAKEFAGFVGVSTPVIAKAKNYGIVPSLKMLIKIADKLELSFLYLLGESDSNDFIPSANPSSFYKRLPQIAEERGENYGHIASRMPFPRTYIYEWLKENTLPSPEYLLALAEYFNISPDYLLGRTDYRN